MKRTIFSVIGLVAVALSVYFFATTNNRNTPEEGVTQDIKELVHDYSVGNIKDQSASITSTKLIVTDSDERQLTYDLPEDDFFVSIAPYISQTHPCANHSLTGCRGEMANKEFNVFIEDIEGNIVIDQTLKSQSNGFIDLWLPRDKTYRIKIAHGGKTVESELSTFENDNTCITTMQLTENKTA